MAETAIPDRKTFLKKVNGRFRTMSRKAVAAARKAVVVPVRAVKKAGGRIIKSRAVKWVAKSARGIASKTWRAVKPVADFAVAYVVKPAAIAGGAALGWIFGKQVFVILAALGGLAITALLVLWLVRRLQERRNELSEATDTVVAEVTETTKTNGTKRTRTTKTVTEVIEVEPEETEVVQAEVVEGEVIETQVAEAQEKVIDAEIEVIKAKVEAEKAESAGNGYKVRLPEGDLDPNETLFDRYKVLDGLIEAEIAKPEPDNEYLCELQARQNLVQVRDGKHNGMKKDATVADIHREFKMGRTDLWRNEHPGQILTSESGIHPDALYKGAMAEHVRVNKIERLKAEHDRIKGEKAA